MKKAALTIALFSTVLVATSFTTPEVNTSNTNKLSFFDEGGTVQGPVGKRKLDFQASNHTSQINLNQSEGFRQERQSIGFAKKID